MLAVVGRRLSAFPAPCSRGLRLHGDSLYLEVSAPSSAAAAQAPPAPLLPRILILTPVKDSLKHLDRYFTLLRGLSYPAHLLSLGMMDSDSRDGAGEELGSGLYSAATLEGLGVSREAMAGVRPSGTLARLLVEAPELVRAGWRRVVVARHDFGYSLSRGSRHSLTEQLQRREVLAKSRNHLLSLALQDEDWVLWLDSDLRFYPADLLDRLVAAAAGGSDGGAAGGAGGRKPLRQVLVPNCVLKLGGGRSYDLNSWRAGSPLSPGSNASVAAVVAYHNKHSAAQGSGGSTGSGGSASSSEGLKLSIEGYGNTGALYLHQFKRRDQQQNKTSRTVLLGEEEDQGEDSVVRLDAVGGAALLVHAELHRHGLVFPPFPYRRRIETEGLSMMAMDMGALSWGMPFLEVLHN